MKVFFSILSLLFFSAIYAISGVIVIEGEFHNENIYIQNSISASGVGFCTYEVMINGQVSTDEVNSNAFEIDLKQYQLELGTPIVVKIRYKDDGCKPVVLNPYVLKPNPTFETVTINVDKNGLLSWTTVNETAELPFIIEQFKWNKWVRIGEIEGKGSPTKNTYRFQTVPHAGLNKFRVKQKGYITKTRYTSSVSYLSFNSEVTFVYVKKKQRIELSEDTPYEVFDKFGNIVKKGHGNGFDVSNLDKDVYYMYFGNTMGEFRRK